MVMIDAEALVVEWEQRGYRKPALPIRKKIAGLG
jgi:hypothetical protein